MPIEQVARLEVQRIGLGIDSICERQLTADLQLEAINNLSGNFVL